ncbi:MAG: DUF885 domain-containing protein [Thermoplasmata archaeon]
MGAPDIGLSQSAGISADSMGSHSFEDLTKCMMDEFLSWNPSYATQVGWHKYDHILEDPSAEAFEKKARRLKQFISTLKGLPSSSLTEMDLLERDLALHTFGLKLFEIAELRLHERGSHACSEIGHSLFFLFYRDRPSFEERMKAINDRLEKVPEFLEKCRAVLTSPYRLWNKVAHETGERLPAFIRSIVELADAKSHDPMMKRRLDGAATRAIREIEEYNRWLEEDVIPRSEDRSAIRPDEYARYLEMEGFGVTSEEALRIADAYIMKTRGEMEEIARTIVPSGSVAEALRFMKSDHPATFEAVLRGYRESIYQAREFVIEKEIATVPEDEKLLVIETPHFMRPMTPFAAQYEPGKFDGNRTGLFLVTPDDGNPDLLREHNYSSIVNTSVHEGYPGHHLQGICANTHPSYVQVLIQSQDFGEGWALYAEELMNSLGYNRTLLGRLTILHDLLFRIARLIVDVGLPLGEMTVDDGARLFVNECGMDPRPALVEARACAMSPTYYASYLIGKLAVMQLRDDVEGAMGDRFSLRFFHDSLLCSGTLPMGFMRRALALRLKGKHGIELGPQKETLYEYAMRRL